MTEAGVKASSHHTRLSSEFDYSFHQGVLPGLKGEKNWTVAQWSKVLFQIEQVVVFHVESKVLESG